MIVNSDINDSISGLSSGASFQNRHLIPNLSIMKMEFFILLCEHQLLLSSFLNQSIWFFVGDLDGVLSVCLNSWSNGFRGEFLPSL